MHSRFLRHGGLAGLAALTTALTAAPAMADVYWTNSGSGSIGRSALDGSAVNQNFIDDPFSQSFGVAVDGGHVYWTDNSLIGRANLDGTNVQHAFINGLTFANGIAVDSSHVYWTDFGKPGAMPPIPPSIDEADLTGSNQQAIPISGVSNPFSVAVDASHIYWADLGNNAIGRANLNGTGSNPTFIPLPPGDFPKGVAVDANHIYWTDQSADTVGRANLDGTGINNAFVTGANFPQDVAVDGSFVYWVNEGTNSIGRAPLNNPSAANQSFITGAVAPFGIAVDAGAAPVNTAPPAVTGILAAGATLAAQHGTWTGSPTVLSLQWESCGAGGSPCAPIAGATGATYTLQPGDVGRTVRVAETADNVFGTSPPATSAATGTVQPAGAFLAGVSTTGTTAHVTIGCHGPNPCSGQVVFTAHERKRGNRVIGVQVRTRTVNVTVGRASFSVPVGQSRTLTIRLNRTGRSLMTNFYAINANASFPGTPIPGQTVRFAFGRIAVPDAHFNERSFATFTIFTSLFVVGVPSHGHVTTTCRGGGCPFGRRVAAPRHSRLDLEPLVRGAHLAQGATLAVTVSASNFVAVVTTWRMVNNGAPVERTLCQPPGARGPRPCRA
jgi:hypothetical protein